MVEKWTLVSNNCQRTNQQDLRVQPSNVQFMYGSHWFLSIYGKTSYWNVSEAFRVWQRLTTVHTQRQRDLRRCAIITGGRCGKEHSRELAFLIMSLLLDDVTVIRIVASENMPELFPHLIREDDGHRRLGFNLEAWVLWNWMNSVLLGLKRITCELVNASHFLKLAANSAPHTNSRFLEIQQKAI